MITHQIIVYHRPAKATVHVGKSKYPKFNGAHGSTEHRKYLLKRSLFFNPFDQYDEVIYRKKKYLITEIYGEKDYDYISWDGLSPKYLELLNKDGEYIYVNHGDIRKARR